MLFPGRIARRTCRPPRSGPFRKNVDAPAGLTRLRQVLIDALPRVEVGRVLGLFLLIVLQLLLLPLVLDRLESAVEEAHAFAQLAQMVLLHLLVSDVDDVVFLLGDRWRTLVVNNESRWAWIRDGGDALRARGDKVCDTLPTVVDRQPVSIAAQRVENGLGSVLESGKEASGGCY